MLHRRPKTLLLAMTLAMALSVLATRSVARNYVFPVHSRGAGATGQDVLVELAFARDGTPVRALELRAPSASRTIVSFHNNRETAETNIDVGRALRNRGFDVVLAEYRGYGASPARNPSEEGLYDDAEAILDMLGRRGVASDRIVLWGTSLGTGVAAEMARRGRGSRLVLVSPYTSIPDLVTNIVPFLPAGVLVPDHFDTLSKARSIRVPTLVVHGDADEIVPVWMGQRLSRDIPAASLFLVAGGHHGDLLSRDGLVLSEIASFAR
jgi:pimeloyl-ACP methyl ester carboxylesterase